MPVYPIQECLDDRNFIKKIICKLFHVDERFIDTCNTYKIKTISLGHKCFGGKILVKDMWHENEFKERLEDK